MGPWVRCFTALFKDMIMSKGSCLHSKIGKKLFRENDMARGHCFNLTGTEVGSIRNEREMLSSFILGHLDRYYFFVDCFTLIFTSGVFDCMKSLASKSFV